MLDTLLDPARRAEAQRDQVALTAKHGHKLNRHHAIVKYLHGGGRVLHTLAAIEKIHASGTDAEALPVLLERLGEAYALQAKFREAINVSQDAARQATYDLRAQAIEALGVKRCVCPPAVNRPVPTDAKGKNYPTSTPIEEVYDGRRLIALTRCCLCSTISARSIQW